MLLLGVGAHVVQRQNRDRWRTLKGNAGRWRWIGQTEGDAVRPDCPGDVLDAMLSHILEPNGDLVSHLLVRRRRQADASRLREGLEARRDVDAIAVEVAVLDD